MKITKEQIERNTQTQSPYACIAEGTPCFRTYIGKEYKGHVILGGAACIREYMTTLDDKEIRYDTNLGFTFLVGDLLFAIQDGASFDVAKDSNKRLRIYFSDAKDWESLIKVISDYFDNWSEDDVSCERRYAIYENDKLYVMNNPDKDLWNKFLSDFIQNEFVDPNGGLYCLHYMSGENYIIGSPIPEGSDATDEDFKALIDICIRELADGSVQKFYENFLWEFGHIQAELQEDINNIFFPKFDKVDG